jgi:glycosyltransferase involved in cell wall biosynthesis
LVISLRMYFSIIIPVYNRPDELAEFLSSLQNQNYKEPFELLIVEDGSEISSEDVVKNWQAPKHISLKYYFKPNSGPGDSRNYGMSKAKGDYFLLFDSDCVLPADYLKNVHAYLNEKWVDCFGGPDDAHPDFSSLQKAITVSMTSFLTTGGVRGQSKRLSKFQPRSFNMGLSRHAFSVSGGFSNIHPGEDPELVFRLWKHGFQTELFPNAKVFHKRRISFSKFKTQIFKFGKVRPILDAMHPQFTSFVYAFPLVFTWLFTLAIFLFFYGFPLLFMLFTFYFFLVFLYGSIRFKSIYVGVLAVVSTLIQFFSYAYGYLTATFYIKVLKRSAKATFPELFFKISQM